MARRRYRSRRQRLWDQLVDKGLLPREADEFSKYWRKYYPPGEGPRRGVRKQYPPALIKLVKERKELLDGFNGIAKDRGWRRTTYRINGRWEREYKKLIYSEYASLSKKYTGNFFVNRDIHLRPTPWHINPWALYDKVFYSLDPEDQWGSPGEARTPSGAGRSFRSQTRYRVKQLKSDIGFYKEQIKRTGDPHEEWHWKLKGAQYELDHGGY